jgi:hypothetical protein
LTPPPPRVYRISRPDTGGTVPHTEPHLATKNPGPNELFRWVCDCGTTGPVWYSTFDSVARSFARHANIERWVAAVRLAKNEMSVA